MPGLLQTKVTIVGKNEIYHRENLVGPFLVHNLLGPKPPLPPPLILPSGGGLKFNTAAPLRTQVPLRRVSTPAIIALHPAKGYYDQPQWVTVMGYGFIPSAQLTCAFISQEATLYATGPDVAFVSATEIMCLQPTHPVPFTPPSVLEVSVDGQAFSTTLIRCVVRRGHGCIKGGSSGNRAAGEVGFSTLGGGQ